MIKPWKDRVEEAAHFREEDYINDVQYFMQAEIDELRAENARLKAVPMKYKRMAFNAELQAENARLRAEVDQWKVDFTEVLTDTKRLRAALTTARTALIEHGSAYLHHELRYQEALDAARTALGEKS